jgi:hypothetical protein
MHFIDDSDTMCLQLLQANDRILDKLQIAYETDTNPQKRRRTVNIDHTAWLVPAFSDTTVPAFSDTTVPAFGDTTIPAYGDTTVPQSYVDAQECTESQFWQDILSDAVDVRKWGIDITDKQILCFSVRASDSSTLDLVNEQDTLLIRQLDKGKGKHNSTIPALHTVRVEQIYHCTLKKFLRWIDGKPPHTNLAAKAARPSSGCVSAVFLCTVT